MFFESLQNYISPGETSRKTKYFVLQREDCAPDMWTCIEDVKRFCREFEKSFCACIVYPNTLLSDTTIMPLSFRQSGVNVRRIVTALIYFTIVCILKSVLVELMTFEMVKVDNFVSVNFLP